MTTTPRFALPDGSPCSRHHSYTIIKGIDPEIAVSRPPNLILVLLDFFYLHMGFNALKDLILHSLAVPSKHVKVYVPEEEYPRMFWQARAVLVLHFGVIGLAVYLQSWLPVLYFGLPRFYGAFFAWGFYRSPARGESWRTPHVPLGAVPHIAETA